MFFHRAKTLLRKDVRSHSFTSYDVEELINKLNINLNRWIVAGTVTANDYSRHTRGLSFKKNMAIVQECDDETVLKVFEQKETFAKEEAASNEAIDTAVKGLMDDVNKFLQDSADAMVLEESAMTSEESTSNEAVDHTMQELVNGVTKCLRDNLTISNRYEAKEFAPPVFNTDQDDSVIPESIGSRKRKGDLIGKGKNKKQKGNP
ncbi:hypothetical protein BGZ65_013032 [Modicella reniformis]|uniref:Uncharacterized protein n=1 Tax=Modicella reniformis TaxID=1440133 RepID=A0A9P6M0I2_9FUNG|nr:hypothetical protein BGZ65_013032 [Modicella reniformis]